MISQALMSDSCSEFMVPLTGQSTSVLLNEPCAAESRRPDKVRRTPAVPLMGTETLLRAIPIEDRSRAFRTKRQSC